MQSLKYYLNFNSYNVFLYMLEKIVVRTENNSFIVGIGCVDNFTLTSALEWHALDEFINSKKGSYLFSAINYSLGFQILDIAPKQGLSSFPLLKVWQAKAVFEVDSDFNTTLLSGNYTEDELNQVRSIFEESNQSLNFEWKPEITKSDYLYKVKSLKNHIQLGDIYEVNYCQNISAKTNLNSISSLFTKLWKNNPTPYACLLETSNFQIASASPELFIQRKGNKLISKPIKGTAPAKSSNEENLIQIQRLKSDPKERSENIMIVDLVRNDLSKIATKSSVKVDELCEIYSFPTVHQMISTISCEIPTDIAFSAILKATFPMGSMTGAPKKRAVELAMEYEAFTRNFYSGSIGIIYPNSDFAFNVLIRSLFYDVKTQKLQCGVGGAITISSDPELEYEECKAKVDKIIHYFGSCQW